jgi:hypothetical protein
MPRSSGKSTARFVEASEAERPSATGSAFASRARRTWILRCHRNYAQVPMSDHAPGIPTATASPAWAGGPPGPPEHPQQDPPPERPRDPVNPGPQQPELPPVEPHAPTLPEPRMRG